MTPADWEDSSNHVLGMLLGPDALLLLLNGGGRTRPFRLPPMDQGGAWVEVISTSHRATRAVASQDSVNLGPHSLVLLRYASGG